MKNYGIKKVLVLVIALVAILVLFLVVMGDVVNSGFITRLDGQVAQFLYANRDPSLIALFTTITVLGTWQVATLITIIIPLLLWFRRKRLYLLPFLGTVVGSALFNLISKMVIQRPRPALSYYIESSFSFPSGHASIAIALYGFIIYVLFQEVRRPWVKAGIILAGLALILLIGLSRLYFGVHYVSDVLGGYLSGTLFLIPGIALVEWFRGKQYFFSSAKIGKL